jgi:ATP-dependent DNA ligase
VELQSKAGQTLTRYFPELVAALLKLKPQKVVLDGEIIVMIDGKLSFDDLLQRIHPAASRVAKLSQQHPAQFVLFDFLVDDRGHSLVNRPFSKRRVALETFTTKYLKGSATFILSPATTEIPIARGWLKTMRGQLDGVVAKRLDLTYLSGELCRRSRPCALRIAWWAAFDT